MSKADVENVAYRKVQSLEDRLVRMELERDLWKKVAETAGTTIVETQRQRDELEVKVKVKHSRDVLAEVKPLMKEAAGAVEAHEQEIDRLRGGFAAQVVAVLNRALDADKDAIEKLFANREPCNEALANDPEIQAVVDDEHFSMGSGYNLGILGLINGLCGVQPGTSWGYVTAYYALTCPHHAVQPGDDVQRGDQCPRDGCERRVDLGEIKRFSVLDLSTDLPAGSLDADAT